jgi:hypothetical protein
LALQPESASPFVERASEKAGVLQVHDVLTKPSDVQTIYDNISARDKRLFWIEGTTRRFDGYNYFGEHPELMLEWFDTHVGKTASPSIPSLSQHR